MAAEDSNQLPLGSGANPSPTEASIRQQLEKILTSPQFVNSPNLQNFLRFIVEKTLTGESADIKGYTVATQVLGREADFDPNLDPIVRILAGRLRRALEQHYQGQGKSDAVLIDVPRGAYVPVFRSIFQRGCRRWSFPGCGQVPMLALPSGPSVAVMPLLNLMGDRKQEYFAEGLAEELTSELARYQELRVIAYQSTRRWQGQEYRPPGRRPGPEGALSGGGSIRKEAKP